MNIEFIGECSKCHRTQIVTYTVRYYKWLCMDCLKNPNWFIDHRKRFYAKLWATIGIRTKYYYEMFIDEV